MDVHTTPLNEKLPLQQLQVLKSLIEVLIRPSLFERELFFSLLLILMRENDFLQIKVPNEACINVPDYILSTRKKNEDIYEATFILNGFQDVSIKILAKTIANVMIVNALIPGTSLSYALCVEPNRYVVTSDLGIPCSIKNYAELKNNLKRMIEPIKSCVSNQFNAKHGTILSLPEALILRILLLLPIKDVLNLSESCKIMNCIVKEDRVWSRLYKRDFSGAYKYEGRGWFDVYREIYVSERKTPNKVESVQRWDYVDYIRCANINKLEIIL